MKKIKLISLLYLLSCGNNEKNEIIKNSTEFIRFIEAGNYKMASTYLDSNYCEINYIDSNHLYNSFKHINGKISTSGLKLDKYTIEIHNKSIFYSENNMTIYVNFSTFSEGKYIDGFYIIGP
jgi:hypothetical protein